jgi:hypothetical protein
MTTFEKEIGAMTLLVPDRKGAGQFAIIVDDVDAACSELAGPISATAAGGG